MGHRLLWMYWTGGLTSCIKKLLPHHNACHLLSTSLSWYPLCQGWERNLWSLLSQCKFSAFRVHTRASPEHSIDQTEASGMKTHLIHCVQLFHLRFWFPSAIAYRASASFSRSLSLSLSFSLRSHCHSVMAKKSEPSVEEGKRWKKWSMHVKAELMSSAKTWFCHDALRLSSSPWINWFFANFHSDSRGVGREWGGTWQMKTERKIKKRNKTNGLFSFLCLWGRENNHRKWEMCQTLNDSKNRPWMTNDTSLMNAHTHLKKKKKSTFVAVSQKGNGKTKWQISETEDWR